MKNYLFTLYSILALGLLSCDNVSEDVRPREQLVLEANANSAYVINVYETFGSFSGGISLANQPANGTAKLVLDDAFMVYQPSEKSEIFEDVFTLQLADSTGVRELDLKFELADSNCNQGLVFEDFTIKIGEGTNILDHITSCDVPLDDLSQFTASYRQLNGPGNFFNLLPVSPTSILALVSDTLSTPGNMEFIFEIGVNKSGSGYLPNGNLAPNAYEHYAVAYVNIEVID